MQTSENDLAKLRMRILIIALSVGKTAQGIVFERLIFGISSLHQVDVLTAKYEPSLNLSSVRNLFILKKIYIHARLHKLFISLFNIDPFDSIWASKSIQYLKKNFNNEYDLILSFQSSHNYASTIAGERISRKLKCKFAVHSLDAIPVPNGWPEDDGYKQGLRRLMAKYLSEADAFFSTNDQMLAYQLTTFKTSKKLITNVIYNPSIGGFKQFPRFDSGTHYFIYTGGIYGARKVKYLLEGFERLTKKFPNSSIIFVGPPLPPSSFQYLSNKTIGKIKVLPYTKELDKYYSYATALIDIDADIKDDVFLSSKIINYIMVNKIIISETGENSPSRRLFRNINSIIQCDHNSSEICEAMIKAIEMRDIITFKDRISVAKLFKLENVVKELDNSLNNIFLEHN